MQVLCVELPHHSDVVCCVDVCVFDYSVELRQRQVNFAALQLVQVIPGSLGSNNRERVFLTVFRLCGRSTDGKIVAGSVPGSEAERVCMFAAVGLRK